MKNRFTFGKTEYTKFKFTGLNIEQTSNGIFVDQIDYIRNIQPISSQRMEAQENESLNKAEFKAYRGLTGQLNWAAENTRPDLAFDVRFLATRNKSATLDVKVKYSKLGHWKTLKIVAHTDSSFKNA